jgi:hypothetical protein
LFVEEKAHGRNKNIDRFCTKTTQKGIPTAISIKHGILATFNIKQKFNSDSLYAFKIKEFFK